MMPYFTDCCAFQGSFRLLSMSECLSSSKLNCTLPHGSMGYLFSHLLWILKILNLVGPVNIPMDVVIQVSMQGSAFSSFRYKPQSMTAGPHSMSTLQSLRIHPLFYTAVMPCLHSSPPKHKSSYFYISSSTFANLTRVGS